MVGRVALNAPFTLRADRITGFLAYKTLNLRENYTAAQRVTLNTPSTGVTQLVLFGFTHTANSVRRVAGKVPA
jgi:hypothetical protein